MTCPSGLMGANCQQLDMAAYFSFADTKTMISTGFIAVGMILSFIIGFLIGKHLDYMKQQVRILRGKSTRATASTEGRNGRTGSRRRESFLENTRMEQVTSLVTNSAVFKGLGFFVFRIFRLGSLDKIYVFQFFVLSGGEASRGNFTRQYFGHINIYLHVESAHMW